MVTTLKRVRLWVGIGVALGAPSAQPLAAQSEGPDSVTVVPGPAYAKSGTYRFFFGSHYRTLWTTPIRVPVLDLARFAGGLTPVERGGGEQTKSLRLNGADGRQYQFRSVDKDPSAALPPELRETFADRVFQDQTSAGHPAGALLVPPILEAAGVLHATPRLYVMPDDPALGEFRAEFADVLGTIEERPRDPDRDRVAFAGARDIASTEKLLDRLENDPTVPVDARAFLRARLVDVFLGDWDRHQDQWRWALVDGPPGRRWLPIPRDRDQAFVRFDGFLLTIAREQVPQLVNFGPDYPEIVGATWNGRDLDRRLLTGLEWPAWDSAAQSLRADLTNSVIDEAVSRLPPEFQPIDGPRLRTALRSRRDQLLEMARDYYRHLAREVDVHASDRADVARVERVDGRFIDVTVTTNDTRWFHRRFDARDTRDLRIYLHGGDDRGVVTGPGWAGTTVRVIGGGDDDTFIDSVGTHATRFYDDRGETTSIGRDVDRRSYRAIDDTTDPGALPHRDWGRKATSFPYASYSADEGLLIGWGGRFTRFGFRRKPWSSRLRYTLLASTAAETGKLDLSYRVTLENSRQFWRVDALLSGIEVLRWHGFGNETPRDVTRAPDFYRATQHQIALAPSFGWSIGERSHVLLGPRFKYSVTELDEGRNAARFIGADRPYGADGFTQVGLGVDFELDTRDVPTAPRRGFRLRLDGRYYPALLDVDAAFASVSAEASTYVTARMPTTPTLAVKGGGALLTGTAGQIPFFEALFLGSGETLRGFERQRFAGDEGALWGSAELRLHFTNLFLFVPSQQGVFGFYDVGRVYDSRDTDNVWHSSFGGGLWASFVTRGSLVSLAVGHSDEGNRVHARVGFAF